MDFEKARDLFDYVSPLNEVWESGTYVFRGQPSDQFKLIPSVCRNGEGSFAYGSARRTIGKSSLEQVDFELTILRHFVEGCDRSGLVVPGYTEEIKRKLTSQQLHFISIDNPWPQEEMHQILAVAQHYEVPTRLLDWTDRSFVACYFAAASANFEIQDFSMPKIAVWALDTTYHDVWKTVKIIRTPGGTSLNQAAQSGLFTAHILSDYDLADNYVPEALDDVSEIYSRATSLRPLIKMTLPVSEAPSLLELCKKMGVDGSTLFPGFHGVAKMVKDWANAEVGVRLSQSAYDDYFNNQSNRD
ncbi:MULTISPECIES: FRG domain-containing protein [Pseudomonas]|uniref:FRG domain-containing protein n=1 Tax=Pseudomonas TaxID=286 RepID=UPI00210CAD3E|nr:FRG domain-containing protein [Pseudomonas sp. NBRC 111136]